MKDEKHMQGLIDSEWKIRNISKTFKSLGAKLYFYRELEMLQRNPHYAWSYYVQIQIKLGGAQTIVPRANMTTNIGVAKNALRTKTPQKTLCEEKETEKTWNLLNKEIPCFDEQTCKKEKTLEKLKYGGIIQELRVRMKIRTRIKQLLKQVKI